MNTIMDKIILKHKTDPSQNIVLKQQLFLINTKYPDGSPRNCTLIPDEHIVDLAGGEEFLRAYIDEKMCSQDDKGGIIT